MGGWLRLFRHKTVIEHIEITGRKRKSIYVLTLGAGTFKNCKSLESVTIAEGVKEIGKNAFEGSGLKTVTIPKGIKKSVKVLL